jgi:hypothetical protein
MTFCDLEADDCSASEGAQPGALRGVVSDELMGQLRERNAQRVRRAIEELGPKWLLAEPIA